MPDDTRALREGERAAMDEAFDRWWRAHYPERQYDFIPPDTHPAHEAGFIAGLRCGDGEVDAVLEEVEEFLLRVTQWTGEDPNECTETIERVAALLAARKAAP